MTESAARHAPGTPCWVSLMVHGLAGTQKFYSALFGWEFRPGPQELGPYVRALIDEHEVAGIGVMPADRHLPVAWTPYLASDDVDATADTIRLCGGTVGVGPLDADRAGRLLIASDPAGAVFGVWQAAEHGGADGVGLPGTPVWNELVTRDTATVAKFYQAVFGYVEEPVVSADFDYLSLSVQGRQVAAIHGVGHGLPRDRGAHWTTFFEVTDVEETVEHVRALGGHVLRAPYDSGHGRMATVSDPEGAAFNVVRSAE